MQQTPAFFYPQLLDSKHIAVWKKRSELNSLPPAIKPSISFEVHVFTVLPRYLISKEDLTEDLFFFVLCLAWNSKCGWWSSENHIKMAWFPSVTQETWSLCLVFHHINFRRDGFLHGDLLLCPFVSQLQQAPICIVIIIPPCGHLCPFFFLMFYWLFFDRHHRVSS